MTEQYKAALQRALILAVLAGASTFLATWSQTNDVKLLVITTATAALAPFIARFGGEGTYDSGRAAGGDVKPSDVGAEMAHGHRTPVPPQEPYA